MGNKKRNPTASRSPKPSSPAAEVSSSPASLLVGSDVSQSEQSVAERDETNYSAIKLECERVLTSFRPGNHTKALRLIKETCQRHEKSALVHRCQATICVKVAEIMDDQTAKHRYLKSGIDSAQRACSLSPNSVEFAHFYANLLYEAAQEGKEYEEVVQECERALAIENPVDPAKESFQEEQKIPTAEGRISSVQQELKSLIQKANIASISTWMKNFGTGSGDEKFRSIPIRRPPEDPMEMSSVQTKRSNEIKKATKTPEERRKEIEVRVAAARLLQQKAESQGESKIAESISGAGTSSSTKSSERRKHGSSQRNVSSSEIKDRVLSYWNSMSYEQRRDLLSIRVSDIKAHFGSFKDVLGFEALSEALSEALAHGELKKIWKFWMCSRCGYNFVDGKSFVNHVVQDHMDNPMPKLQKAVPPGVDNEWAQMLETCNWQPLDLTESTRTLDDNGSTSESRGSDKYVKLDDTTCDESQNLKIYTFPYTWPLSDDAECGKLLEKVSSVFQLLIRDKCLSVNLLEKVIQSAMDELRSLAPKSSLLKYGIDQTPLCICFLGEGQLRKIIEFLQEVFNSCGVGTHPEKIGPDDTSTPHQLLELQNKLVYKEDADASYLLLDESLQNNSDSLLAWIFAGQSTGKQLATWSHTREERKQHVMELLQSLEKDFGNAQSMCERKYEHVGYAELLQGLEQLCMEERNKREHVTDFTCSSYDSVLRNRRDEIIAADNEAVNKFELDAIHNILKETENIKASQYVHEESNVGAASHLGDTESGEENWKSKDYLNQLDSCIEVAIQRQKEQLSVELSKIDARIMRSVCSIRQLEHKLESDCGVDYSSILNQLVKSFLRAQLEDLAEKDATKKSDAAREALLAELELESKKTGSVGSDHSKKTGKKLKDKKRNKGFRKNKDTKISSFSNPVDNDEPASSSGAASVGECVVSEVPVSDSDDDLKKMEEEFRRKTEIEAQARKLEEVLEYQRRIENEAKQKHLADQQKGVDQTGFGMVALRQ